MSVEDRLGQVDSGYFTLGQGRLIYFWLGQVISFYVRIYQVRSV